MKLDYQLLIHRSSYIRRENLENLEDPEVPQDFQSGMMSVPVTIRDDARDGASDVGRIVAGTAGFIVKDKGSQVS